MSQAKAARTRKEPVVGSESVPELLSMNEVMERLKIGRTTLRFLINQDPDFVTLKLGERRLMSVSALESFVAMKERETSGGKAVA